MKKFQELLLSKPRISFLQWVFTNFPSFQVLLTNPFRYYIRAANFLLIFLPFKSNYFLCSSVYVDMGAVTTDSSTIAFAFTGSSTTRIWEIKVSQIECTNGNRFNDFCANDNIATLNKINISATTYLKIC